MAYRMTLSGHVLEISTGLLILPLPGNPEFEGYLAWVGQGNTPAPIPESEWRPAVLADFKVRRETYLNRIAGLRLEAMDANDTAFAQACKDFRQGLLDLPDWPAVVAATSKQEMEQAIFLRYRELVAAAKATAPQSEAAFDKVSK